MKMTYLWRAVQLFLPLCPINSDVSKIYHRILEEKSPGYKKFKVNPTHTHAYMCALRQMHAYTCLL